MITVTLRKPGHPISGSIENPDFLVQNANDWNIRKPGRVVAKAFNPSKNQF
jgi:hypothetical protein